MYEMPTWLSSIVGFEVCGSWFGHTHRSPLFIVYASVPNKKRYHNA